MTSEQRNYDRIEKAIAYIRTHFKAQISLDDVAAAVHLSPWHCQRLFSDWAGVSPKKFLQYISIGYAKTALQQGQSLLDAATYTGLSGTGRLHDLFVTIEGMTPGEYKQGGAGLTVNYASYDSPFGEVVVASTTKGVCHMTFVTDEADVLATIRQRLPNARFHHASDAVQRAAAGIFAQDWQQMATIKLHLAGSPFQLKVWESLLTIPVGALTTYGAIARRIGNAKAARAVGTAVGHNPVAFLIPCHRVIRSSGVIGDYAWGTNRKTAIIGWEAAKIADHHAG